MPPYKRGATDIRTYMHNDAQTLGAVAFRGPNFRCPNFIFFLKYDLAPPPLQTEVGGWGRSPEGDTRRPLHAQESTLQPLIVAVALDIIT